MRGTGTVFTLYLVLIVAGIAAAIVIGLTRSGDDPAAGDTVERFAAALEEGNGRAACAELSAEARNVLESQEASECEQAIVELDLSLGEVSSVEVADTSATVELAEGGSVYLDDTSEGWRISAVGCEPRPSQPDDCEIEA
jgi:hypothetical protein